MRYVGIDVSNTYFTASAITKPKNVLFFGQDFENTRTGFDHFHRLLDSHGLTPDNTKILMEATGVYSEALSIYCWEQRFPVYVEPGDRVKKAFRLKHKNDKVDSGQIAEYGYRFDDELHLFKPRDVLCDTLQTLLTIREQLVKTISVNKNSKSALNRKLRKNFLAVSVNSDMIDTAQSKITEIDKQLLDTLRSNPDVYRKASYVKSCPGIGWLFTAHVVVMTDAFTTQYTAKQLAAYIGICPHEHMSGSSIRKRSKSDKGGPGKLRKLLYLASMSLIRKNPDIKTYYDRKVREGKPKKLVLNNISNKLLKIITSCIRRESAYYDTYKTLPPL